VTVVDRDPLGLATQELSAEELATLAALEPSPKTAAPEPQPMPWRAPARALLAVLLVAAGAIHLVMVPSHASEWLPEGVAFAVAGWLQIGLALALVTAPSRIVVRVSVAANLLFAGAWVLTRVSGWPIGPEAGVAAAATFVDVTALGFEVAAIVLGYELLVRPALGAGLGKRSLVVLSSLPVAVLVLATVAIASPSAANHAHDATATATGADHPHRPDATAAAAANDNGASGGGHDGGATGHDHGAAAPADDKGLSLIMNGAGEGGGHIHTNTVVPLDAATQQQLDAQLAKMQPLMERYPTVKDAEAAGYRRQGPYSPGLGAHYGEAGRGSLNTGPTMTDEALKHPMLIYDGIEPDSKLAGFMYMIFSLDKEHPPEGFAGPNDQWHFHTDVCITMRPDGGIDAPLGADSSATKELCDKYGGILIANTGYMVHVWPVPGYESPQGLFSNLNAELTCPDGTYYVVEQEEIGTRSNICKDVAP